MPEKVSQLYFEPRPNADLETLEWVNRAGRDAKERGFACAWAEICPDCLRPSHEIKYVERTIPQCECSGNGAANLRNADRVTYSYAMAAMHGLDLFIRQGDDAPLESAAYRG